MVRALKQLSEDPDLARKYAEAFVKEPELVQAGASYRLAFQRMNTFAT